MVGSFSWLRLRMRWATALLSSRWPSRSGAIAGDAGLPRALPVCEGRTRACPPYLRSGPPRAFSRRLTQFSTLAVQQAIPYRSHAPQIGDLRERAPRRVGSPVDAHYRHVPLYRGHQNHWWTVASQCGS